MNDLVPVNESSKMMKARWSALSSPLFPGVLCVLFGLLSALFGYIVAPSSLLRFVHTTEAEWYSMYENLAVHLSSGMLVVASLFLFIAIFNGPIKRILDRLLRVPGGQFIAIIVIVQSAICLVWLIVFPADIWADGISYHRLAVGLASGVGYVGENGQPTAYYPIGYPFILSILYRIFGTSLWVGKISNAAMIVGAQYIWYHIGRRVWNETTARICMIILTLSLSLVSYTGILFSEPAFLLFFSLSLYGIVGLSSDRAPRSMLILAGICTGIGALIRPVALLVPLAYAIAHRSRTKRRRIVFGRMAIVYALAAMVLLPNIIRNFGVFGSFVPISTNGGINFWIGNNPSATGYYVPPTNVQLTGNEAEQSRQAYALGMRWVGENPGTAAITLGRKFFHLYHRDDQGILFSVVRSLRPPPWTLAVAAIVLDNIVYYLIFILSMYHVFRNRRTLSISERFLVLFCLLMTGFYLLYFGAHRFHFPAYPVIAGFAAAELARRFSQTASTPVSSM